MLKPDSIRAALTAALPDYARDPDRLVVFAEKGRIATRPTAPGSPVDRGFEYRYDLRIILLDFTGHLDAVILPLLDWLATHQPDQLQTRANANEAIAFDAEFLGGTSADLELTLRLTEAVGVVRKPDGGIDFVHHAEPGPIDPGYDGNPVLLELMDPAGVILPYPPAQ
ncbi:phage tail protein [Sphingomonas sp. R647]|uniref:phage tail protein n=1 Tax=Sphingomonas sp. R647 TaxID=2875233 RepID=UPI001CD6582A|nr:phage tail protein [Sphingomonas sp. R647]MCA1199134.1 phage tail protein [Sphingomonas sp. R647]